MHQLSLLGVIQSVRGRSGGLRLGREPAQINIGAVVRSTETDFFMAECFDRKRNACILTPACKLKGLLYTATAAYMTVLDNATLEDLMSKESKNTHSSDAPSIKFYMKNSH